jgi:hypothetical protein
MEANLEQCCLTSGLTYSSMRKLTRSPPIGGAELLGKTAPKKPEPSAFLTEKYTFEITPQGAPRVLHACR